MLAYMFFWFLVGLTGALFYVMNPKYLFNKCFVLWSCTKFAVVLAVTDHAREDFHYVHSVPFMRI